MSDKSIRLKQDHSEVLLIVNGVCVAVMPWEIAQDVARNMAGVSKKAEEFAKRDSIIADQALLTRVGAGFGLSDDPKIQAEAMRDAQWDSKLRKVSANYQGVAGTPSVKVSKPTAQNICPSTVASKENFGKF